MSFGYGLELYYSLFGIRGLLLAGESRTAGKPAKINVRIPEIAQPVWLRLRTTDVALCREIFVDGIYDQNFSEEPETILDAGANIGLSAVFFANRFPHAKIVAVEPEASNYAMLVENTEPYSNVSTIQAALWKENGEIGIFDPGGGNTTFQVRVGNTFPNGSAPAEKIRAITVDQLMSEFGIASWGLLKMDIEGAEKDVFEQSQNLWISHVAAIAVETHDSLRPGCREIVKQATSDFTFEWQKADVTYLSRRAAAQNATGKRTPRLPLKIIRTA